MKVFFVALLVAVSAVAGQNSPSHRSQAVFLLPPKFENAQPPFAETERVDEVTRKIMERLRQEEGALTGAYYVYLPDGKLQRVEFTTAPLKSPGSDDRVSAGAPRASDTIAANNNNLKAEPRVEGPRPAGQGEGFQPERLVQEQFVYDFVKPAVQEESARQPEESARQQQTEGFVASVQYTDVDPLKPPVYSYDKSPLVRILRYAPNF